MQPVQTETFSECQVCFADDANCKMKTCGHCNCCTDCMARHMEIKIKEDDVIPWICCPFPDCHAKVAPEHFNLITHERVREFCIIQYSKILQRNSLWVNCTSKNCKFGFLVYDANFSGRKQCKACNKNQLVTRNAEQDDSIKELLKSGAMRKCPKCGELTMKDKGLCNIINCGKCSVWWNWQTRETGNSQREMKNRARDRGTLWEPGELQYQQRLERTNPEEFRKLLERNGIKYDPNYRRGGR